MLQFDLRDVDVDANRIELGLEGPALGSAALKELIDRLAMVCIWLQQYDRLELNRQRQDISQRLVLL